MFFTIPVLPAVAILARGFLLGSHKCEMEKGIPLKSGAQVPGAQRARGLSECVWRLFCSSRFTRMPQASPSHWLSNVTRMKVPHYSAACDCSLNQLKITTLSSVPAGVHYYRECGPPSPTSLPTAPQMG